ncbi:MAG: NAD(P)/FAD-dependent oxidoreductase [Promethearchaeota archaeon]
MKIVIIGDGVAGQLTAENLRKKDKDMEIVIYTKEPYPYYSRIYLPHYIAGEKKKDQLFLRDPDWFLKNKIVFKPEYECIAIKREAHKVVLKDLNNGDSVEEDYDKLVLAVGSHPRKIAFGNENVKGVFALRSVEDADAIKNYIKSRDAKKMFIIGGGLLGIELGFHLKSLGADITICEIADRLLPRQLCSRTSKILQNYLENKKGLNFILNKGISKILGDEYVKGVEMEDGTIIDADIVFEQLGIIPNIELAKASGLKTNRGIVVNEYMLTADPDIYAVGDCVEFNGRIWGIIPAAIDQSKIVASHIFGKEVQAYTPTIMNNKLKIAGIDLISIGNPVPKDEERAKILWNIKEDQNICIKVIVEEGVLTGTILIGEVAIKNARYFLKHIGEKVDLKDIEEKIKFS